MKSFFTPDFFQSNRRKLRKAVDTSGPIVTTAHGLLQRNSDTSHTFRQDSNFWYLTGINEPDIILVIDSEDEYIIVPSRKATREAFDGSIDIDLLTKRSGIQTVLKVEEGWRRLENTIKRHDNIATLQAPSSYIASLGMYTNPARQHLVTKIKEIKPAVEINDVSPQIIKLRSIKQESELQAIQKAIDITTQSLISLSSNSFEDCEYEYEYEVEAAITYSFNKVESTHAYQPIVASGKNACTLHYIENKAHLNREDLLLLDVGAEVEGYAADITRTYSLGRISDRQQQVITAVSDVQEYAKSLLKPGLYMKDYELLVEAYMGKHLQDLKLIKEISHETVREYYPHATSHFLGLDVHDVGNYDQPLEAGMVVTVEPGIYIAGEGIGVRLEDDMLLTDTGAQNLSSSLPLTAS